MFEDCGKVGTLLEKFEILKSSNLRIESWKFVEKVGKVGKISNPTASFPTKNSSI